MKLVLALICASLATTAVAATSVDGHFRKDGTYVPPHQRSDPDNRLYNNYGAQGNTNPYTGERGTQRHEFSNPPAEPREPRRRTY